MIEVRDNFTDPQAIGRFVQQHPQAWLYHLPVWGQIVQQAMGHQPIYLTAWREQELLGLLPLGYARSMLFGKLLVSMPLASYGGIVTSDDEAIGPLWDAAVQRAETLGVKTLELRQIEPSNDTWQTRRDKVSYLLDLPGDSDTAWKALPSNMRNRTRKGEKRGLTPKHGGLELVDDFYNVFAIGMHDLGVPVFSKKFFTTIIELMPDVAAFTCVYLDNRCVAGGIHFTFGDRCEVPWSSSLREYRNSHCTNMYLFWQMIERAANAGCSAFDFGRSPRGGPTCEFKKQWGCREIDLNWHTWAPQGSKSVALTTGAGGYQRKAEMWKKLPLWLANLLGPRIVRGVP